jgi:phosphohistidine phosphatase SixA
MAGWLTGLINAFVALAVAGQGMAATEAALSTPNAPFRADALQRGGYVIFVRHAQANAGSDATPFDLADCSRQRNLSEEGKEDARRIGAAFDALRIPVGDVLSSEYCRALETAGLAFRRAERARGLNLCCLDGTGQSESDRRLFLETVLATRPRPGTNTVLVGHGAYMMTDLGMGEAAIYLPDGRGGYLRVARVQPIEWQNGIYRPGAKVEGQTELLPVP